MRGEVGALVLTLCLAAAGQAGAADPRALFTAEEQWMLDALLAYPEKKAAFEQEGALAAERGPARYAFVQRWRQETANVAYTFQQHLLKPIIANAPRVEKMISDDEYNLMNYWLARQKPETQKKIVDGINKGNGWLGWTRETVETDVNNNRRKLAKEMDEYLASAPTQEALAYRNPLPTAVAQAPAPDLPRLPASPGEPQPPAGAMEQLQAAARNARIAAGSDSPETAAGTADTSYSGGAGGQGGTESPAAVGNGAGGSAGNLTAARGRLGGFKAQPPPSPMLNRDKPIKSSMGSMLAGPAIGAAGLGILGFLLMGPLGAILGAVGGAVLGFMAGKAFTHTPGG